jgi:hypothetical protein
VEFAIAATVRGRGVDGDEGLRPATRESVYSMFDTRRWAQWDRRRCAVLRFAERTTNARKERPEARNGRLRPDGRIRPIFLFARPGQATPRHGE